MAESTRRWSLPADTGGLLAAIAAVFAVVRYAHDVIKLVLESSFVDFAHYYTFTSVVRLGSSPFDAEAVALVDASLGLRRAGSGATYPPLFYVLMQPWVLLPFGAASIAWLAANQAWLLASLGLCARQVGRVSFPAAALIVFTALSYQPLMETLAVGQVNLLVLFLVTAAWWGLRTGRPWLAAGAIALVAHVKVQYAFLLLWIWCMRQPRVAVRSLVVYGLGLAVALGAVGSRAHADYARFVLALPESTYLWTANLSLRALLHKLLAPLAAGPTIADGLTFVLDAAILIVCWRAVARRQRCEGQTIDWSWALGLCIVPLISPLTEEHHLVVLLLPLALLVLDWPWPGSQRLDGVLLVTAVTLLGSRYSLDRFPDLHRGAAALLTPGKLGGVAILTWALLRRLSTATGTPSTTGRRP